MNPCVANHLSIRQLGTSLLYQVLQLDGAVLRSRHELAVTSSIVALCEVAAFQDPFISTFSGLQETIFDGPARGGQHHALRDQSTWRQTPFGVFSNRSL